MTDWTVD